jgi:hypothetical protein
LRFRRRAWYEDGTEKRIQSGWGLLEITPEYRKQLAEIVNAYWEDRSNAEKYREQVHMVFLNACRHGHAKLPQEAVIRGGIPTIARVTGIERKYIKYAISNNGLPLFYDFRHACIVSIGDDIEVTKKLYDFSRPFLTVGWPEAVRIQEMVPTS